MLRIRISPRTLYTIGVIAGLLLLVGGYSFYRSRSAPEIKTIAITELMNRAEARDLHRVVVSGPIVYAVDANGLRHRAVKEEHVAVTEVLRSRGVDVAVESPGGEISPGLLMGLVPIVAILVLFFLTARRAGAGNP